MNLTALPSGFLQTLLTFPCGSALHQSLPFPPVSDEACLPLRSHKAGLPFWFPESAQYKAAFPSSMPMRSVRELRGGKGGGVLPGQLVPGDRRIRADSHAGEAPPAVPHRFFQRDSGG